MSVQAFENPSSRQSEDDSCSSAVVRTDPKKKTLRTSRIKLFSLRYGNPGVFTKKLANRRPLGGLHPRQLGLLTRIRPLIIHTLLFPFEVRRWQQQRGGSSFIHQRKLAAFSSSASSSSSFLHGQWAESNCTAAEPWRKGQRQQASCISAPSIIPLGLGLCHTKYSCFAASLKRREKRTSALLTWG